MRINKQSKFILSLNYSALDDGLHCGIGESVGGVSIPFKTLLKQEETYNFASANHGRFFPWCGNHLQFLDPLQDGFLLESDEITTS